MLLVIYKLILKWLSYIVLKVIITRMLYTMTNTVLDYFLTIVLVNISLIKLI